MLISTINHTVRKKMGISCAQYLVLDMLMQTRSSTPDIISGALSITPSYVDKIIEELAEREMIERNDNILYLSSDTVDVLCGVKEVQPKQRKKKELSALAVNVITYFNSVNATRYEPATYASNIDAIKKAYSSVTMDQFESVIRHKAATWGQDEKMSEYNRPGTIFRNPKRFMTYVDDARLYWLNHLKSSEIVELGR